MSEKPATYSCGAGCTRDAVTDLASERTELMDEMAAALEKARAAIHTVRFYQSANDPRGIIGAQLIVAELNAVAVLTKYQGRGEAGG